MSTPRADWLLGLPLTIFRDMWLTLNHRYHTLRPYQIQQHRRGIISTIIPHISPIRHPYSDYRNVNIATPISRERQEITRLLPVLLAEHLFDMDSGAIHRFLGFMHLGFHFIS
jgi:hypothetical protein